MNIFGKVNIFESWRVLNGFKGIYRYKQYRIWETFGTKPVHTFRKWIDGMFYHRNINNRWGLSRILYEWVYYGSKYFQRNQKNRSLVYIVWCAWRFIRKSSRMYDILTPSFKSKLNSSGKCHAAPCSWTKILATAFKELERFQI